MAGLRFVVIKMSFIIMKIILINSISLKASLHLIFVVINFLFQKCDLLNL